MATFQEANQLKSSLKMKFINYSWFRTINVIAGNDGYDVVVITGKIDNSIRKIVAPVINGINNKLELE